MPTYTKEGPTRQVIHSIVFKNPPAACLLKIAIRTFRHSKHQQVNLPVSNTDGADAMFNELNVPITDEEVRVAISSLKNRKACGHDNVRA